MYYIGIDIGGTYIKVGFFDEKLKQKHNIKFATHAKEGAEFVLKNLANQIKLAMQKVNITNQMLIGIGVCAPGVVNTKTGVLVVANNLPFYETKIATVLEHEFGCSCFVQHDVTAAALAEQKQGALKGVKDAVYFAMGTGLGAAYVKDGNVQQTSGHAFELGHVTLVQNGRPCTCGRRGCIDAYCSATGLTQSANDYQLNKGNLATDVPQQVFALYEQNDSIAQKVVTEFVEYLTQTILSVYVLLHPQKIVIGGGLSYLLQKHIKLLKTNLKKYENNSYYKGVSQVVEIGLLYNHASMLGAVIEAKYKGEK